jgi:8-oxo-dGTP pyrophosphatase MutT (NUDIX family)
MHFKKIMAGGGLVENEKGQVLFMFRRNKWDLPKGKLDEGETMEACAVREVMEETGLGKVELKELLLITHHRYEENQENMLKETHWYRMFADSGQKLIPQLEEQITLLQWMGPADFPAIATNTYPSILELLQAGGYLANRSGAGH